MSADRFMRSHIVLGAALLAACGGYRSYAPVPLDRTERAFTHAARRLNDAGLARFLAEHGAGSLDSVVTPTTLALVAIYFRSDLAESRAQVEAALAGEITSGTRPPLAAAATTGRRLPGSGGGGPSWSVALAGGLTLETGGKRGARLARAGAVTLATKLRLQAAAWRVAQDARIAAIRSQATERDLAGASAEVAELRIVSILLRARYAEGRISLADLAQAETEALTAVVGLTQARRARTDARAALARALGVSLPAVERMTMRNELRSACETADSTRADSSTSTPALELIALRQREDVGAALADYAVAEADLRLQITQQYPDLVIGPGIAWDNGIGRWLLSIGSGAIPAARNRGPIAEAQARRVLQAARYSVLEDSVLAQVDSAAAGCRDVRGEIAATDSLVATKREQLRLAEAAFARGETGLTEVALVRLALVRATRVQQQALGRRALLGASLEAAIGQWLSAPGVRWPTLPELLKPSLATRAGAGGSRE